MCTKSGESYRHYNVLSRRFNMKANKRENYTERGLEQNCMLIEEYKVLYRRSML